MQKKARPLGITCIGVMSLIAIIGSLIILASNIVTDNNNQFVNLGITNLSLVLSAIFLVIVLVGFSLRNKFLYFVSLIGFIYMILSSVFNLFRSASSIITNILFIVMWSLIVWYLVIRKDYLKDDKEIDLMDSKIKKQERFFAITFILLWVLFFLLPSII